MKLPLNDKDFDVGDLVYTPNILTQVTLHNEQIAAQLTMTHCSRSKNSKEDIDATYKEYLDKLNKGDL